MNNEEFINKLEYYLRYLSKKERKSELEKYQNTDTSSLDPVKIANEIYLVHNLKIKVTKDIKFMDAMNIILNNIRSGNQKILTNILKFILYILKCLLIFFDFLI